MEQSPGLPWRLVDLPSGKYTATAALVPLAVTAFNLARATAVGHRRQDNHWRDLVARRSPGSVVVLNVWGSWCAPCRAEAPDLAKISKETAPRGVRFVGIDVRDNPAAGRAFEREFGITCPSFDDHNGLVLASFTGIVPVSAVPSTLVIDRDGIIRARNIGRIDAASRSGLIEDAEKVG